MTRRILREALARHAARISLGLLLLAATNALGLSIPWLFKQAIDGLRAAPAGVTGGGVGRWALAIIAVASVASIIRTGSRLALLGASRQISYELRQRLFERVLSMPPAAADRMRTGDLMSRAVNDMLLIRSFFGPGLMNAANTLFAYIGSIAAMAWIDPGLCLAALLPYPVILLAMNRLSRAMYSRSVAAQEQLAVLSSRVQENLSGMTQVKAFVRERAEIEEFAGCAGENRRRAIALARVRGAIVPLMGSIGGLGTLAVLWLGGSRVVDGRMTLGDFVAFNGYLGALAWPTLALGWIINVFQRGLGAMERIGEIIDAPGPRVVAAPADAPRAAAAPAPAIEIRDLTFRYEPHLAPALADLSVSIAPGETIGITGPVGAGKSTLLALVAGLYTPPAGSMRVGGEDLASLPPLHGAGRIGWVPQESFLLSRTIAENIALGRPGAPRAAIEEAAGRARLSQDLPGFPDGWDTLVGERGITLSGGQRQRAALARALLLDAPLLLLDDTYSAVDADTEAELQRSLRPALAGRTVLVVSHRLSAIASADRILVLDKGRLVESGRHADLLSAGGLYARLHRIQMLEGAIEAAS